MGDSQALFRFADFSKGEYGLIGGRRAPQGSFTATDMLVHPDGGIGPRPGAKNTSPTGLPAGEVWGFGNTSVPGRDGWVIIGDDLYRWDMHSGGAATLVGALSGGEPTRIVDWIEQSNRIYFLSYGDGLYRYNVEASTIEKSTNAPGAATLGVLGDRLALASTSANPYRIFYSEPPGFLDFPALNFFDMGDVWPIERFVPMRNMLLAIKRNGWWAITGTLGVDYAIRRLSTSPGVLHPSEAAVGWDDQVWHVGLFDRSPSAFNGSTFDRLSHLEVGVQPPADLDPDRWSVVPLSSGGTGQFGVAVTDPYNGDILLFHNGAWTRHTIGFVYSFAVEASGMLAFCDTSPTPAAAPKIWTWNYRTDTPPLGGTFDPIGEGVITAISGTLTLPEVWSPERQSLRVREVWVDCDTYDTGATDPDDFNHFDLTVRALGLYETTGSDTSPVEWDEDPAVSTADGTSRRLRFHVGDQQGGHGFVISFAAVRGVVVNEVHVIANVEPGRRGG